MTKVIAISQARIGSTRLPGKVLKSIKGKSLLQIHVERILKSRQIHQLIIATTISPEEYKIVQIANKLGIQSYQGSVNDVLDRFYQSIKSIEADYIVRLTSDCPLIDAELIDAVVHHTISNNLDYCSNTLNPTYPDGQDVEVFKYEVLKKAWENASLPSEREHVTPYIWKNSTYKGGQLFNSDNVASKDFFGKLRMTVDEPADFELIKVLIDVLGADASWLTYAQYLLNHEKISDINSAINRNEGYKKSISNEKNTSL